ncbi:hypothetical protein VE02_02138 [Pseudogymnoascus sp. 03VT05]|nr:hypothetical protein VE02_02138 [Pseudogymnoascus sp. 03VT05]
MSPTGEQALADQHQGAPPPQSRKSGGGGGGSRGGKGRSGGGGQSRDVQVSKALSKLLRHDAVKAGLELDDEGFAGVGEVLQWNRLKPLKVTFDDILTSVSDNSKQRFALKLNHRLTPPPEPTSTTPSDWLIRANQGHSIAIESSALLTPITLEADNIPPVVVHGTYYAFYPSIVASGGLKKMSRNHIHFSTGLPEDKGGVVSGMRNDAEVLIYVDVRKSLEEGGTSWWVSDNGVVLSEGDGEGVVGTGVWKRVEGRKKEVGVLWEEGREVGELPQEFRDRKGPSGKGVSRGDGGGGRGKGKGKGKGRGKGREEKGGEAGEGVACPLEQEDTPE